MSSRADYVDIEIDQLYSTAVNDLPILRKQIVAIIADIGKHV